MGYYAKIENETVVQVIVADEAFVENLDGEWLETELGSNGGKRPDGTKAKRKNYAGVGYFYDRFGDFFHPPKPDKDPDAVLDRSTGVWKESKKSKQRRKESGDVHIADTGR